MKQSFTFILSFLFMLGFQTGFGQWELTSNIVPSFYNSAVAWDGKVYFAGGLFDFSTGNNKVQILDLESGNLLPFKTLSAGRGNIMAVAHNGKIYFAGGLKWVGGNPNINQAFTSVDIYDVAADTFALTHLSVARGDGAVTVVDDKILFAGGYTWNGSILIPSDVVDIYNTTTQQWEPVEHLSQARGVLGAAAINGKAYFCGGMKGDLYTVASNVVDIYVPSNVGSEWSVDTLSVARGSLSVVAVGEYLLVAGGSSDDVYKFDVVDKLDTETGQWDLDTLSHPRCLMAAAVVGKTAYFTGGGNCNAATFFLDESTKYVDVFEAENNEWSVTSNLVRNRIAHAAAAWGDKIAVGGGWQPEQNGFTGSVEVFIDVTGIDRDVFASGINIFPNPTSDHITIQFPENFNPTDASKMTIFDLTGRACFEAEIRGKVEQYDIGTLPPGMYLVEVRSGQGRYLEKLVVGR